MRIGPASRGPVYPTMPHMVSGPPFVPDGHRPMAGDAFTVGTGG